MKIGRVHYLSLLEMSNDFGDERRLLIEPLAGIFEQTRNNAQTKIEELSQRIRNSQEEVIADENDTTNHDIWEGHLHDVSFEYELQIRAISTSLIIVAQSYLHSKFQHVVSAYEYFKQPFKTHELRDHYFSLGPEVNGIPWADGVKAASNYVRHFEEWKVTTSKYERISGHLIVTRLKSLVTQLTPAYQATPRTLAKLGFDEDAIFDKQKNLTPDFVQTLKLHEPSTFDANATKWIDAVMADLHQRFDRFEK